MTHVPTPPVIVEYGELPVAALRALMTQDALVVRVTNFVSPTLCRLVATNLLRQGYHDYINAPTVGRIGMSFYETGGRSEIVDQYFDTAGANIALLRNACSPYALPMDTLRCVLDEVWPNGALLQSLTGRKMFVGLSRSMRPGAPLLAHHDVFARLAPNDNEANDLLVQVAANIYIDMPAVGGELLMWRDEISDAEFLQRRGSSYGLPLDALGAPDIEIKPGVGDLILFNARKLHAVAPGMGNDRLTLSCFVGYRGADQPLSFWS
jgi:hypothetical protein